MKAIGRILSLILSLLVAVSMGDLPASTRAKAVESGSCGEKGAKLDWSYCAETGLLTLSGSGAMRDYQTEAAPWAAYAGEITGLSLPEGMTKIGSGAFSGCCKLRKLTLPKTLVFLGSRAFSDCTALSEITLSPVLQELGREAFCGCAALQRIDVPSSVKKIGIGALARCTALAAVTVHNPRAELEPLFESTACSSMPENVTVFGHLFSNAHALAVETQRPFSAIGNCDVSAVARGSCADAIQWELNLRQGLLKLSGFGKLEADGFGKLPWETGKAWIRTVMMDDAITEIPARAFANCEALNSASLSSGLKRIGAEAFAYCGALQTVSLPEGVECIESNAFDSCTLLKTVVLPTTLKQIREMAFYGCVSLSELVLPEGLESIGANAFMGCAALHSVEIPAGVRRIPDFAFSGCSSLRAVTLRAGVEEIGAYAFCDCPALESLKLSGQLKRIGTRAFSNCVGLQTVSAPQSLREIQLCAFQGCKALGVIIIRSAKCLIATGVRGQVDSAEDLRLTNSLEGFDKGTESAYQNGNDSNENLYVDEGGLASETLGVPNRTKIFGRAPAPDGTQSGERQLDGFVFTDRNSYSGAYGYSFYQTDVFTDVAENKFYEIPVAWASGEKVTEGVSAGRFGPNQTCTRGQFVTFLWRAERKPAPAQGANPFQDVKTGKFYYNAVRWAVQNGVTTGTNQTHFSPNQVCTRAEVVTFLWRAMGCPKPSVTAHPFVDVKPGKFYYRAMLWAVENNITTGTDATHFEPAAPCTRGQVVTFLFRAMVQ